MKRQKKIKTIEEHVWEPLKKHELTLEEKEILEFDGTKDGKIEILNRLKVGEFLVIMREITDQERLLDTTYFQNYVTYLHRIGVEIGKGDAEYGFKMPLPENGQAYRELIIFRRRKAKN